MLKERYHNSRKETRSHRWEVETLPKIIGTAIGQFERTFRIKDHAGFWRSYDNDNYKRKSYRKDLWKQGHPTHGRWVRRQ